MNHAHSQPRRRGNVTITVLVPVTARGEVESRFGRAPRVAVATVLNDAVTGWQEYAVGWDAAHDCGSEGSHHARIVRFLSRHDVDTVVAEHIGAGMVQVLRRMGIRLLATRGGDARAAVLGALAAAATEDPTDRQ